MRRSVIAVMAPPLAVCRYGCAGCCAAPIGVFWLAGIGALIYGLVGGPLGAEGVSWWTVGLGVVLWAIAAAWAETTIRGVALDEADRDCTRSISTMCRLVSPRVNEDDPFDQVKKYQP